MGLTDPQDAENNRATEKGVRASLPARLRGGVRFFHLRGGIDYGRLSFGHRLLMKLMYSAEKRIPEEKRSAQGRAIIQTYGSKADFTDLSALQGIAEALR